MRRWLYKLLRWLLRLLLGLVVATIVVYALLIHPNDARMSFPDDLAKQPHTQFFERHASFLLNRMPHSLDMDAKAYEEKRQALMKELPDYALPASSRFVSPYQIYVPVGAYPMKLDAQDGLFLPSGSTLTVEPKLTGDAELRFAAYAPKSGATLTVGLAGAAPLLTEALPPPPRPWLDPSGRAYNDYWRFLRVDPTNVLEVWQAAKVPLTLTEDAHLTIHCSADALFGCIVGDLSFYGKATAARQNFLIVLVDTLRADAVRAGHAPHMAALTDAGFEFTNALAPGNMTSPSTNAFLSCQRANQLGELAFSYGVTSQFRDAYYRRNTPSFPERFLRAGYDTAMIGNVSVISEIYGVGISHGFARQIALETDSYATPAIAREAIQWLAANGDHPFLLYVHFDGPHAPYRAPFSDIAEAYPGASGYSSYPGLLRWLYQGKVAYSDRYVGKLLDSLKQLGLDKTTTVVLTADHGEQQSDHRYLGNTAAPDFTGAYFDHGATLLNDEIHVPLVVRQPGAAPGRATAYVSALDIGPTLFELAGIKDRGGCAGESLVPYLTGGDTAKLAARPLASEGFRGRTVLMDGRYKYIRTYDPTDKRVYAPGSWRGVPSLYLVPEQLFDLTADPREERDLSATAPELMARGRQLYRELFGVRDSYELVIESPASEPFEAGFGPGAQVSFEEGEGNVSTSPKGVTVTGSGRARVLMELHGNADLPRVKIGDKAVPVTMTSMRLPLAAAPAALPAETGGRYTLLAPGTAAGAYIRKVEDDGQKNRRLVTGNPAFDKVLREWGYLNDK